MFSGFHSYLPPLGTCLAGCALLLACSSTEGESNRNGSNNVYSGGSTSTGSGGKGLDDGASAGGTGGGGSSPTGNSGGGSSIGSGGASPGVTGGFNSGGNASGGRPAEGGMGGTVGAGGTGACTGPLVGSHRNNPLFTDIFTADPAILVKDCTFYITAGRDAGTTGFNLKDWYVLSSQDMINWSDNDGPVMDLSTFAWANANAWAGQMVERNSQFYWYVPVAENHGPMAIGVAVSDSPLGPFTDSIGKPLVSDAVEMAAFGYSQASETVYTIDPSVFIDDDGRAYLVYGGFWRMVVVPLGDDMVSLDGDPIETTPPSFFEAPYLTKREGTYYLVYAAGQNPATIDYVTAPSPTGPWQNHGRILDELPASPGQDAPTSHPAIAEFLGQWYLAYHLSNGPGGGTYRRQVAVDKLTFNGDGSIQKIIPSSGLSF